MSCLGGNLAPVSGSSGAAKRRELLRRQLPLHDISADLISSTRTPEEQDSHKVCIFLIILNFNPTTRWNFILLDLFRNI